MNSRDQVFEVSRVPRRTSSYMIKCANLREEIGEFSRSRWLERRTACGFSCYLLCCRLCRCLCCWLCCRSCCRLCRRLYCGLRCRLCYHRLGKRSVYCAVSMSEVRERTRNGRIAKARQPEVQPVLERWAAELAVSHPQAAHLTTKLPEQLDAQA